MYRKQGKDEQYLGLLEDIEFRPIFILGLHRSGTTILYKMLSATGLFNSVTAYHIMKFDETLYNHINNQEETRKKELTWFFSERQLVDRVIDQIPLEPDLEEEYGHFLGLRFIYMRLNSKNLERFCTLAKKIQFISENDKPLLLKNPFDFNNFTFIKREFPNAKFVFIHRHPLKTISSWLRTVRLSLNKKNPYVAQLVKPYEQLYRKSLRFALIRFLLLNRASVLFSTVLIIITMQTRSYLKQIRKLPPQDYFSVRYEDLCENPDQTIKGILSFLQVDKNRNIDFKGFIKPRRLSLDSDVAKKRKLIYRLMQNYFKEFGYNANTAANVDS